MISYDDVENFLRVTGAAYTEIGDGLWLVHASEEGGGPAVAVSYTPPLLVLRSEVLPSPEADDARLRLYERLLELNATEVVHGAYGLEDGAVILSDALELENLDYSEFRASLESLTLAVASHLEQLARAAGMGGANGTGSASSVAEGPEIASADTNATETTD